MAGAFIHRFGASLNTHPHLHLIVIDGVITRSDESLRFHPARLNRGDVETLREAIRLRVLRLFRRRGLLEPDVIDNLKAWGHGGGFSIHADVRVPARDKAGRERLLRYCARPIYASERLSWVTEGERLRYRLTKPGPKGQTELILSPDEFARLILRLASIPGGLRGNSLLANYSRPYCHADPASAQTPASLLRSSGAQLSLA